MVPSRTRPRPRWRLTGHPKAIKRPSAEALALRRLAEARAGPERRAAIVELIRCVVWRVPASAPPPGSPACERWEQAGLARLRRQLDQVRDRRGS
jgi:hypothetical protein